MDGSLRVGIHTSISGSYLKRTGIGEEAGGERAADFFGQPRMWQTANVRIPASDVKAFRERREELGLGPLVIHANYLINLQRSQPMLRTRSIQAFHEELVRGRELGARTLWWCIRGRAGNRARKQAIATIIESVKQAARRVPLGKMRILIENTAGMGRGGGFAAGGSGGDVRGLREIKAAVCLDTAHLFAAGYDIKSEIGLERAIETIDRVIGLENVPVFQCERFERFRWADAWTGTSISAWKDWRASIRADFAAAAAGEFAAGGIGGARVFAGDAD